MNLKIQIRKKTVYGNDLTYPANEIAAELVKLTGKKTFTADELDILKSVGFEIEQII